MTPDTSRQTIPSVGAVMGMRLWFSRSILRPGAAWTALAGAIAAGVLTESAAEVWLSVLLLILLVDPIWGGLWDLFTGERVRPLPTAAVSGQHHTFLPYLQPGSPAARLMGWLRVGRFSVEVWRSLLPMLALAAIFAWVLGWLALIFTLGVLVMAGLAWAARHTRSGAYGFLQSAALVGLPYGLAVLLLVDQHHPQLMILLSLGLGLSLLAWGMDFEAGCVHRVLLAGGTLFLIGLPAYVQSPLWAGFLSTLVLPGWLLSTWCDGSVERHNWWLRWTSPWWLIAIFASAWAIRL